MKQLDELLAMYCAPALAGIKAANLVAVDRIRFPKLPALLAGYRNAFGGRGLRFDIIRACEERFLLLVYSPRALQAHLSTPEAQLILERYGYPAGAELSCSMRHLVKRMAHNCEFPHEIGLFLGYPAEDVQGFINYGGRDCKLCGAWKVYGDADAARNTFARYAACSRIVANRVRRGESLLGVFAAS